MTRACELLTRLRQLVDIANRLPGDATFSVDWTDAPTDLVMTLAEHYGADLKKDADSFYVTWSEGKLTIRATVSRRPTLRLVQP